MPATEQTWRDQKLLHAIFAVSGVVLLISTVWMFAADHSREWKPYQRTARNIDIQMNVWRGQQFQAQDWVQEHERLQTQLAVVRSKPLDPPLVERFIDLAQRLPEHSDDELTDIRAQNGDLAEVDPEPLFEITAAVDTSILDAGSLPGPVQEAFGRAGVQWTAQEDANAAYQSVAVMPQQPGQSWLVLDVDQERAYRLAQSEDRLRGYRIRDAVALRQIAERLSDRLEELQEQLRTQQNLAAAADNGEASAASDLEQAVGRIGQKYVAVDRKADAAEQARQQARNGLVEQLVEVIRQARFAEDRALTDRKFKAAELDAEKAKLGLAVRDHRPADEQAEIQAGIDQKEQELQRLTLEYQEASQLRKDLQSVLDQMQAEETQLAKQLRDNEAERDRLLQAADERRSTYFSWVGPVPLPGKKWLELPILDAFNSPLRVENLWSDGLTIDYNFARVRRFDRCTTCHQAINKTLPGSADQMAYEPENLVRMTLLAPTEEQKAEAEWRLKNEMVQARLERGAKVEGEALQDAMEQRQWLARRIELLYGIRLADYGLLEDDDVTVSFVWPNTPSAAAGVLPKRESRKPRSGQELRELLLQPVSYQLPGATEPGESQTTPGLLVGDVIQHINGDKVRSRDEVLYRLLSAAEKKENLQLVLRRGLPNPYASHPRIDLYVGSMSPHPVERFGCTSCHDGQGSATAFKWASHTPTDVEQRKEWVREHGWFDNPHWIYPMYPERFAESACLRCHHEVVELEASERFPDPPAPKLAEGYHLIRKYGCYGCHEINGFDGSRRLGPDLRLEPNYFAVAQQISHLPLYEALSPQEQQWVHTLIQRPEDDQVRRRLLTAVEKRSSSEDLQVAAAAQELAPLLKDIENPGDLRKAGPSLRHVNAKLDTAFLYDWIRNPQSFRPSTRMPRFFGLWDHLTTEEAREGSEQYEPIEILGLVTYLERYSQPFEYLQPSRDVAEASAERGRVLFQERGCLACHSHAGFPEVEQYRPAGEIVQGPDLSRIGDKFDPQRNPNGPQWLYTWLREPNRYHVRTLMPDVKLEPTDFEVMNDDGTVGSLRIDPAADIVTFLIEQSRSNWQPAPDTMLELDEQSRRALDSLVLEHLKDAFYEETAAQYVQTGIPVERAAELKGAERELVVDGQVSPSQLDAQKLLYVGNKTVAKYGCYGCHDIPGFEGAKPIGTTLADWGRKDPSRLAFEHIVQYLEHGGHHGGPQGAAGQGAAGHGATGQGATEEGTAAKGTAESGHVEGGGAQDELPEYYLGQIEAGHRAGFIYQKLREPRSYDYHKTENKRYNEQLRMPQFPFDHEQREAVVTFVLGLVADPPNPQFVYQPDERQRAILEGRQVVEKYNCAGCHMFEPQQWEIAHLPEHYGEQASVKTYPFLQPFLTETSLQESARPDRRGLRHARLVGMPALDDTGLPIAIDQEFGDPLEEEENYDPAAVEYGFELWRPTVLDGHAYQSGVAPLYVAAGAVERKYASEGGVLASYLLPHVIEREKEKNPAAKGSEAWGWLPPPLMGEGNKVQGDWLHDFLLDPYPIRPAVVLRMPKFNMSNDEAEKLVNYFAARDRADYPYEFAERRRTDQLAAKDIYYPRGDRLRDAMRIVTDGNYCIKCHEVGDFVPEGRAIAKAPDLADVYRRLRGDYLRDWIANPKHILPYTSMPVNIPYDPDAPNLGGVSQDLYQGTSLEQLDALVDLLMNFDEFTRRQTSVAELVEQSAPAPPGQPAAGAPPAAAGTPPAGAAGAE